jgi:hypothetical protein
MLPDRYYVADVHEGPKLRRLYFYAKVEGLKDPEYGYSEDDSWIEPAYRRAVNEIERGLHAKPGVAVTVSEPREISPEGLVKLDPDLNVHILKAIALAKEELGEALHPIRVMWHWQTQEDYSEEAPVYLTLADDVVMLPAAFGLKLQQLGDESLMKERIRRLYRKLLEDRSRKLVMDLLRMNAVAGKD